MRLYAYTNMYTEGIHAGIQTAHVLGELINKYPKIEHHVSTGIAVPPANHLLYDWLANHKTIYIYNGGLASMLWNRYEALREFANQFELPIARFYESKEALNGALTSVAIVVPEKYYQWYLIPKSQPLACTNGLGQALHPPKTDEEKFYEMLHNCDRAR